MKFTFAPVAQVLCRSQGTTQHIMRIMKRQQIIILDIFYPGRMPDCVFRKNRSSTIIGRIACWSEIQENARMRFAKIASISEGLEIALIDFFRICPPFFKGLCLISSMFVEAPYGTVNWTCDADTAPVNQFVLP